MLKLKEEKMLNKMLENEDVGQRRVTDLYEEGIIKLGDEIPYIHSEGTYLSPTERNGCYDQTFSTKGVEMKWQAIGIEEFSGERCLKLIAKKPVFQLNLRGAKGYVNGVEELHKISQLFVTEKISQGARSITIEDVNQLLDIEVDEKQRKIYQIGYSNDINTSSNFLQLCKPITRYFTPESFLENKHATSQVIHTAYTYNRNSIIGKEKEKEIIFLKNGSYWLASHEVNMDCFDFIANFGLGSVAYGKASRGSRLFSSQGYCYSDSFYVRPILYMKPNVTLNILLREIYENDKEKIQRELEDKRLEIGQMEKELKEKMQELRRMEKKEEKIIKKLEELSK